MIINNIYEIDLRDLDKKLRLSRLQAVLTPQTPAVILAGRYKPLKELVRVCAEVKIPLAVYVPTLRMAAASRPALAPSRRYEHRRSGWLAVQSVAPKI